MPNIKLLKEPGFFFDLAFMFFANHNKDNLCEIFDITKEKEATCLETLKQFGPISDDSYIFFHALKNGRCFFSYNYLSKLSDHFLTDFDMNLLHKKLIDTKQVVRDIIGYYFYSLDAETVDKCMESKVYLFEIIKTSAYSDTEKSRFYEFFMNPEPYIAQLRSELAAKSELLEIYYTKNYSRILDIYNSTSLDTLKNQFKKTKDIDFENNDSIYMSYCLLNDMLINWIPKPNAIIAVLGVNYISSIVYLNNQKIKVNLDEFGSALSDKSRMKMLDLMLERGEVTCKELEKEFSFAGSTAYHHLTTMLKYGVIKNRSDGKIVFYRINPLYFSSAIELLKKYSDTDETII